MQKIISVFQRNYDSDRLVRNEVVSGAEWVLAGEGTATVKYDGTCCRVTINNSEIILWKRYDAKKGKAPPIGFEAAQAPDPVTGHWPGWVKCNRNNPADRWFFDGFDTMHGLYPGTYELIGPKVQGNPYRMDHHELILHGSVLAPNCPRDFDGIREYLNSNVFEGIVFHHDDGRMCKVKRRDFGFSWPIKQ